MTHATPLGFLSLPQFTGPEGEELLALIDAWLQRHDVARRLEWTKDRPEGTAIGMYYIRAEQGAAEEPA